MSGRGRGRGGRTGGGGRGGSGRDQPPPAQSSGGGGRGLPQSSPRGRGGGGGRGPIGQAPSQQAPRPQPQPQQPAVRPVSPIAASPAATSSVASSSTASTLSHEVQRKLTLKPPVQTAKMPVQKSTTSNLPPASSKAIQMPPRPGYGKLGQRCIVRANHFLVTVADTTDLHHYDVAINPEVTNKKVRRSIMTELDNTFRLSHLGDKILAYDGSKSAYSPGPLPFASKDFVVKLQDKKDGGASRERDFKVSIKFAAKADLHHLKEFLASRQLDVPQETIQALDVVLRALPSQDCSVVGRSFFHEQFGRGELGEGLKFWKGFYQSLRPTQMGLSLNIDISARAFYEHIPVTDFVGKFLNRELTRILADQERVKLKKAMRGIRVEFRHKEYVRRYKVLSLSLEPMNRLTFQDINGERITVVQYFRQKYNIALRYTHLPALNAGSDAKPTYIPMEVCTIVDGQRYLKKLNERQVANLLKATCERPYLREKSIEMMVGHNNYKDQKIVKDFGIVVNTALANVEARVLAPPRLLYNSAGKDSYVEPRVGQWNMINKKMINGGRVETWSCVSFSRMRFDIVDAFVHELLSMCSSRGMAFNPQPVVPVHSANPRDIEKELIDIHSEAEKKAPGKFIQLLIIILPDISGSYGKIKRICETELGIVSQCCQPKQAQKCNRQYLENLSLKINVKVGGRNTVLESAMSKKIQFVSEVPTIIFGADVTHPAPGQDSSPSIAAVVASMDWPEITKYRGLVSAQGHRDEMINDLYRTYEDPQKGTVIVSMIRELMIQFRVATGQKPLRIIFYRDGVSEGQFSHVLLLEMDAIRKACQSLEGGYLPPVTFVVVQKRHHTRLFPANHNDQRTTDKSGNILPGTVVDTSICHPSEFDFYLCSHAGIQGTSRPTHYHVLYDENRFSADGLQSLTNNLCYTYARCTRSVSIVPPAFYAHLAAFRARYYVEGDETTENEENTGGGSGGRAASTREGNLEVRPLPAIRDNVKAVMFYC